jgi:hypothetical protein
MSAVKACPIHRTPLASECQSCGCSQKTYIRKFPIEYCQSCGVSLAKRQIKLLHSDICKSWVDIGFDVIQFFRDMASDGYRPLPIDGLQKSLDKIFSFYWSKDREEDFYNLLSRDELLLAVDGEHRLSFLSVRRVAQRVGIPIYMLLSGQAEFSTEMLELKRIKKLPDGLLEVNKKVQKRPYRNPIQDTSISQRSTNTTLRSPGCHSYRGFDWLPGIPASHVSGRAGR